MKNETEPKKEIRKTFSGSADSHRACDQLPIVRFRSASLIAVVVFRTIFFFPFLDFDREGELFFVWFSLFWIPIFGIVVLTDIYLQWSDIEFLLLGLVVAFPAFFVPFFFPNYSERKVPFLGIVFVLFFLAIAHLTASHPSVAVLSLVFAFTRFLLLPILNFFDNNWFYRTLHNESKCVGVHFFFHWKLLLDTLFLFCSGLALLFSGEVEAQWDSYLPLSRDPRLLFYLFYFRFLLFAEVLDCDSLWAWE